MLTRCVRFIRLQPDPMIVDVDAPTASQGLCRDIHGFVCRPVPEPPDCMPIAPPSA